MTEVASSAVFYSQNTWNIKDPTSEQMDHMIATAQAVNTSGFTAVLLGQWHVWANGEIFYNDTPLDDVILGLQVYVTALKMGGGSVQKVLISFGPFGSDFDHIGTNLDAVKAAINSLRVRADIDGIDFDLEQEYTSTQADTLVELTQWARSQGMIVTAAPYADYEVDFWTALLPRVGTASEPGFAWWNLQMYGGATWSTWESAVAGKVPNAAEFLVPGWNAADTDPSALKTNIQDIKDGCPDLSGAFVWKLESMQTNGGIDAYAAAIHEVVG